MKITITLSTVPVSVCIEGDDQTTKNMIPLATEALLKLQKIYMESLQRQTKLQPDKKAEDK